MAKQQKRALKAALSESLLRRSNGIFGAKRYLLMRAMLAVLIGMNLFMQMMAWSLVAEKEQRQNTDSRKLAIIDDERIKNQNPHLTRSFVPVAADGLQMYTREMARRAIRSVPWTCGDERVVIDTLTDFRPIFSFVHVFKTAGSTLRDFFKRYSLICRKSWMTLISCSEVKSSSIRANEDWKRCRVKEVVNGRHINILDNVDDAKEETPYPTVNNTILRENIDIYGGHIRIGSGDFIHGGSTATGSSAQPPPVRHIVFLRDPMTRFVSGILYEQKQGTMKEGDTGLTGTVKLIKKRVRGSRKANEYWKKSTKYLLTPAQSENIANMTAAMNIGLTLEENRAYAQALTAIQNLVHYNVIMGMAEQMAQSMTILRHALLSDRFTDDDRREYVDVLFESYDNERSVEKDDKRSNERPKEKINLSERDGVSTALVLGELKKDDDFMPIFQEYVKYEQMINDFATEMHQMQFEEAKQKSLSKQ